MAQQKLFTDAYVSHLRSNKWQALRAQTFRLAFWRCQVKECKERCTDLHHLHYRTLGNERPEDVLAVCRPHHDMLEREKVQARNAKGMETYMAKRYGHDWRDRIEEHEAWEDFEFWLERKGVQVW